jgi:cellulose synthase/poly-beta-1,6-N-acetylglucosamine synthase-like glycosyltransferase
MHNTLLAIFLLSSFFILHTYLIYPLVMMGIFRRPRQVPSTFANNDNDLPVVAVLVAAYNEEKVIGEKIRSIFDSSYPQNKLRVYVGSDASGDSTDNIISGLQATYPNLELVRFQGRVGKISIINYLQSLGDEDILVMTDANVIFDKETIFQLVKYFRDDRVGIVAGNIVKKAENFEGIARQEKVYLSLENRLKAAESNAFNIVMGAEGGCYAIRNSLFSKVPLKFIVDDFFITMQVILRGKAVLFNRDAKCFEDVPGDSPGEYRRKVRISSGNFQNLFFFRSVLLKVFSPLGFSFWSHKVFRWLTPFFLFFALISSLALATDNRVFTVLFILQLMLLFTPVFNYIFKFRSSSFKFISHFYLMNFALLEGFIRFVRGIKSSVWQPLKRNV